MSPSIRVWFCAVYVRQLYLKDSTHIERDRCVNHVRIDIGQPDRVGDRGKEGSLGCRLELGQVKGPRDVRSEQRALLVKTVIGSRVVTSCLRFPGLPHIDL